MVGYDAEVLSALFLSLEQGRGMDDDHLDEVKISATNNSSRDIQLSATVISGHFPKGREAEFQEYVFVDASSNTAVIKPREKAILTFNVILPQVPTGSDVFIWQTPWLGQMLLGAKYVSPAGPPPNCMEQWNRSGQKIDPTLADISVLSSYAADRFNGAWIRKSLFPGMPLNLSIQTATIPVRGAIKIEVYLGAEPRAVATLYEGPDKGVALEKYKASANSVRSACSTLSDSIREWIGSDCFPTLVVDRITAYSEAMLTVHADKPNDMVGGQTIYETYWSLQYNPQ